MPGMDASRRSASAFSLSMLSRSSLLILPFSSRYEFQSAIFKRKGRIEERRIQGDIDRMAYDKEDLGMLVERQKEAFRQYSDSLLSGVLLHRIKNLNMLSGAY